MSKGILVVVSGFSGSGKGTVMKRLMEKYDNYALSVSVTTRNPRPGEKDGEAYFFRTKEEFEQLIREDGLIEYAQYVKNYYGTPRKYVEEQLSAGKDVIHFMRPSGVSACVHPGIMILYPGSRKKRKLFYKYQLTS